MNERRKGGEVEKERLSGKEEDREGKVRKGKEETGMEGRERQELLISLFQIFHKDYTAFHK